MPTKLGNLILYDVKELSQKLKVTPLTLKTYINKGRIKGQKIGNKWWITEESLREFLNQGRTK